MLKTESKQSKLDDIPNIEMSEEEIEDFSNKLCVEQIKDYAVDYGLSIVEAKRALAEYLLYNYKLNA